MGALTRLHTTHTQTHTHTLHTHFAFSTLAAAATEDDHIWPWDSHGKRRPGLRKRGENAGEIVTVCFTWAFAQKAKTIDPLESQVCFHVRGPKARGGTGGKQRGQIATERWQNTTSVDISI